MRNVRSGHRGDAQTGQFIAIYRLTVDDSAEHTNVTTRKESKGQCKWKNMQLLAFMIALHDETPLSASLAQVPSFVHLAIDTNSSE